MNVIDTETTMLAGYANEIGEAFKSHISRGAYFGSYLVASSYALGDASSKSLEMYQVIVHLRIITVP